MGRSRRNNATRHSTLDSSLSDSSIDSGLSRRALIKYSASGLAVAMGGAVLTACGSSSGSKSGSTGSGGSTGTSKTNVKAGGTLTAAEKQTLLEMAGPSSKSFTGKGMTWKIGGAFPFSGPYQYYETIEADGLRLAAQHIPQLGGPTIDLNLQDFGGASGVDTQKAVDAMLNFHDSGNGISISGIQGALGSLIPGAERYKILNLDAGAGVGTFASKDYYWAMRANYPMNNVTVALEHAKIATPSARSACVVYDSGAAFAPVPVLAGVP